ncbi:MAG: ABC transporter ATP-binding protein [Candidatus Ancillula sp.]|jgi:ABC-2 type transport system ATP-binding protein|nr:ABC transporter ATP-binding protein [Candidatus Ancillula sp.]
MNGEYVVEVQNLSKEFGDTLALDDVNLLLPPGQVLGFLGPNGAGKSTTIRVLLGMIKASSGVARIFERDCWQDAKLIHERVSYVPGEVNLWGNLTGGEVIDLFMSLDRSRRMGQNKLVQMQVREKYIDLFEFDPSKKIRDLSKGNKQKVALIAAFCQDANLFIFDEPTSGLDPLMQNVFEQCVLERKAEGKSVLLSSHIMSEVETLADTVTLINQGEIVGTASMEQIRNYRDSSGKLVTLEELFQQIYASRAPQQPQQPQQHRAYSSQPPQTTPPPQPQPQQPPHLTQQPPIFRPQPQYQHSPYSQYGD